MAHSNQIREFLLTKQGIDLVDVYVGPAGVLTGSARQSLEAQEKAATVKRQQEIEHQRRQLQAKRESYEAKIAALRAEFEAEKHELEKTIKEAEGVQRALEQDRNTMAQLRKAASAPNGRRTA